MLKKICHLLEQILTVLFWVLLIFGFDSPKIAVYTIIAALLHECGHVAILVAMRKKASRLPLANVSGFRIKISSLSYKEELLTALGGPAINLLICAVSYLLFDADIFALLNLMTALSNLLPIEGYDGYKISICAVRLAFNDPLRWEKAVEDISFIISALLTFSFLFIMLKIGEGYWSFAIFFYALMQKIAKEQRRHKLRE